METSIGKVSGKYHRNGTGLLLSCLNLIKSYLSLVFYIRCVTNCANKVNPNGRLSMESKIKGWRRGMEFQYWWEFYAIPIPGKSRVGLFLLFPCNYINFSLPPSRRLYFQVHSFFVCLSVFEITPKQMNIYSRTSIIRPSWESNN